MSISNEEKRKLYSIFTKWKETSSTEEPGRSINSNVLLIDGANTYLRAWAATSYMNENGIHIGGIIGFLKSVGYAIKLLNPTRCIVVFDGIGGSLKRRKIFPEYKERRKTKLRLNRTYIEQSDATEEEKNMGRQYFRLAECYLKALPINELCIDYVEADDTIAYCATDLFKKSESVTIMSSDKDFLQLANSRIKVWSPTKKKLYGPAEILNEYGIHPNNFVLYRAMDGDDSDNIDGISGAGLKTIIKHFPFLQEEKEYAVNDLVVAAEKLKDKYKVCNEVVTNSSIIDRNVSLMQLKDTFLTTMSQLHINELLESSKIPKLDRFAFIKYLTEDQAIIPFGDHQKWLVEVCGTLDSIDRSA